MRVRLNTRPAVLFGALLLVALIVVLPMRLMLGWLGMGDEGLVARRVSGTIWSARLSEARFGDIALGDLDARLSPLALLGGRGSVMVNGVGANPLHGTLSVSRHGYALGDMTASIATGRAFSPVPVSRLDLDSVSVRFRDGQCDFADGRVRATLMGDVAGIVLPQSVGGAARCEGPALVLPLVGQAGAEGVTLRIRGDGRYTADLTLQPSDPGAARTLAAAGFVADNGRYRLSIEGRF